MKNPIKSKLIITILIILCLFTIFIPAGKAYAMAGDGTAGNPFVITTIDELQAINDNLSACYILGNDIDASATSGWNGGAGFIPIGLPFAGQLDGKGYSITDLHITPVIEDAYLFTYIASTGVVKNINIVGATIASVGNSAAGLCFSSEGTITNVTTSGTVTTAANDYAVGLVAYSFGPISDCNSSCTVSAPAGFAAGFGGVLCGATSNCSASGDVSGNGAAGFAMYVSYVPATQGTADNCHATGDVTGIRLAIGFCGVNFGGLITKSYSTGTVVSSAGWAVGFCWANIPYVADPGDPILSMATIKDCYSSSPVTGVTDVAGFCLENTDDYYPAAGELINCYSTGLVTGANKAGFCFENTLIETGTITSCYWDMQTSGCATSDGGTGKTTAQMMQQATFVGWNFTIPPIIWYITEGVSYPSSQTPSPTPTPTPSPFNRSLLLVIALVWVCIGLLFMVANTEEGIFIMIIIALLIIAGVAAIVPLL